MVKGDHNISINYILTLRSHTEHLTHKKTVFTKKLIFWLSYPYMVFSIGGGP